MIIDYDTIEFQLSTHSVGGITVLDIELANFIEDTIMMSYSKQMKYNFFFYT